MSETAGGTRRVYLHVGVPKSGTTYLQELLAQNRATLRRNGIIYPLPHREAMFHAAVDVRGTYDAWGLDRVRTEGTWAQLCQRVRGFEGTGIISHEILSAATPEQIAAAVAELEGLEIHVVLTARDPGRSVSAAWQEGIKNGDRAPFAEFQRRLLDDLEADRRRIPFWNSQDIVAVLDRWSAVTTPDRVHVVTGPPSGAPRDELWRRFCAAVDLTPELYTTETSRSANESLGAAQVAVLREVNGELDGGIPQPLYAYVVKRRFAQRILRNYPSRKLTYPSEMYEPLAALGESWMRGIKAAGYTVHGDLEDLLPVPPASGVPAPDDVTAEEKYDVAKGAIAELLVELARHQGERTPPPRARVPRARRFAGRVRDRVRSLRR